MTYVNNLGSGWNLGNTFDSHDIEADLGEQTWDNPKVSRELIQAIKAEGFQSIRIPLTLHYRMDSEYMIDSDYLDRYEDVVRWALEEDLYVLINLHHDSTEWLNQWDGQETSDEYKRFVAIWTQLADRFSEYNHHLFFESINEPSFEAEESEQYTRLAKINRAFHSVVRESGGLNTQRMLVLPTLLSKSRQADLDALLSEIQQLNDPYLIASIHYYGEWEFSNNIGVTMLDDPFRDGKTQRELNEELIGQLERTFTDQQIGVLIGEYGLLGFDRHPEVNNVGETYKFIEQMNGLTRDKPIALMLWDNGQHFNRVTFGWGPEKLGDIVVQSMFSSSAYGSYIDMTFIKDIQGELFVNLEFNETELQEVLFNGERMLEGQDYEKNEDGVYFFPQVIERLLGEVEAMGNVGTLTFRFNTGATWNQDVYLFDQMILGESQDTEVGQAVLIPVDYAGNQIKRVSIVSQTGEMVTTLDNWPYLVYLEDFIPDYQKGQLILAEHVTSLLNEGDYTVTIETHSNDTYQYVLTIQDSVIAGHSVVGLDDD
ncbi:glycoside hydrolase family 5 protein [Aerococcaceae bacterium DSM 111021]|nr:glycoside hydrolase family 5 protein [Aerococcaceae bacterium DSM 111021]